MGKMEQLFINKKVFVIVGRICSGKSVFSQILKKNLELRGKNTILVDVGNIVRDIKKSEQRVFDPSLDKEIIERLNKVLEEHSEKIILIVGVRQNSIISKLELEDQKTQYIYLFSSEEERKKRFDQRNADKDIDLSFEEIEKNENDLGLLSLIEQITNKSNCEIIEI